MMDDKDEEKVVRSFNVYEDDAEWLDSKKLNASEVVRELVREYVNLGKTPEASLSVRVAEINADIKDRREKVTRLESEIEELERKREDIRDRLKHRQRAQEDVVAEVAQLFRTGAPRDQLHPTSEVITAKANDADITPTRLVERVKAELAGGDE